ncbi:MAG: hypothetical protein WCT52_00830 [Candidatus Micrarchaeia archaeon]
MAGVVDTLTGIQTDLTSVGYAFSIILIVLGGLVYGFAQMQPSDQRGKYITAAYGMIIGGVVVAAITGAASGISSTSKTLLT